MGLTLDNTINDMRIVVNDVVDNVASISLDTIDNLGDVDISGVNDQHILQFNSATQNFESVEFPTTVAGSDTQIQFNDGGELAGDANLTFDISTSELSVPSVNTTSFTTSTAEITTGNVDSLTANTLEVTSGNVDSLTANTVEVTTGNVDSLTANTINASGVVCASSFEGDGSALTGIDLTSLSNVESLTFDSTGDEILGLPTGDTANEPSSPQLGFIRYNSERNRIEVFNGTEFVGIAKVNVVSANPTSAFAVSCFFPPLLKLPIEYLVVAGGGGGGSSIGGGGGAGGYRTNAVGELSGELCSAEPLLGFTDLTCVTGTVSIGAGGSCNSDGTNSCIDLGTHSIVSCGGGYGGRYSGVAGGDGGSGGGGEGGGPGDGGRAPGSGTPCQGFDGGNAQHSSGCSRRSAGGGGAGSVGGNATGSVAGDGGCGQSSCITGTCCVRAAGGAGGAYPGVDGIGFDGGGSVGGNGATNTGGGGGACGAGGSGVVILRYPCTYTITVGAGLTSSTSTVGDEKVTIFTAGSDEISLST